VQEANSFAVWQATQRRVQRRSPDGSTDTRPLRDTLSPTSGVAAEAERRYADFNGLDSVQRGAEVRQAMTAGRGVAVRCEAEPTLRFRPSPKVRAVLLDEGGLRCSSSAQVEALRMPAEVAPLRAAPIPLCGMGLPSAGACAGALGVVTNDWALVGDETRECKLACRRSVYRGAVQSMWTGGGMDGARFAERFAGRAPVNANQFHFSYSGIESDYYEFVGGEGLPRFRTGGPAIGDGMVPQHHTAGKCFLGRRDCR
jgi:hypothetical protein